MNAENIVSFFIDRINAHDVEGLCALMTEDHRFTDGSGQFFEGRDALRAGWTAYLAMVPDYRIEIEDTFIQEDHVALFGYASGTYAPDGNLVPENHWRIPAAWHAVTRDDFVARWSLYADLEPIRRLMHT
jgi:uncharacterized protein (TIGR02246 family)